MVQNGASELSAYPKLADVCDRERCSRCSGQIFEEQWFRVNNHPLTTQTTEGAKAFCASHSRAIVTMQQFLAKSKRALVERMRVLDPLDLADITEESFPKAGLERLATEADELGCHNVYPDSLKAKKRISYMPVTRESILQQPEILEKLLARCADQHPGGLVREIEASIESGWQNGIFILTSAPCFIDLTPANFGKTVTPSSSGLHKEGIYSYMKAHILLRTQYCWLRTLCFFNNGVAELDKKLRTANRMHFEGGLGLNVMPYRGIPLSHYRLVLIPLQVALQNSLNSLNTARETLETVIMTSISSGEALASDHADATAWRGRATVSNDFPEKKISAWYYVTCQRLTWLSMMYAFERDINRCRITAKKYSRKKATKTALLSDWESLGSGVVAWLHLIGSELVLTTNVEYRTTFSGNKGTVFTVNSEGRAAVVPEHRFTWAVQCLTDCELLPVDRIDAFRKFMRTSRHEKKYFPWDMDFVLDGIIGVRMVAIAMHLLQPLSMREFSEGPDAWPDFGGDAATFLKVYSNANDRGFQERFRKSTWDKLDLQQPGRILTKYRQAWNAVLDFVAIEWRKLGATEGTVENIAEFHRKAYALRDPKPTTTKKLATSVAIISLGPRDGQKSKTDAGEGQQANPTPSAPQGDKAQRPKPTAAFLTTSKPVPPQDKQLELPLFEFGSLEKPSRPSMFGEELTWDEQQQRRGANVLSSKDCAPTPGKDSERTEPTQPEPVATPQIGFVDAQAYDRWRNVFPLATTKSETGCRLKWDELCSALKSPPLDFKVSNAGRNILKFHRAACDGWPAGVITIHKGHGLNPRLEKHDLDLVRKDLRKEFGWTADDFVLAEQKGDEIG